MENTINVEVVTPRNVIFSGQAISITVPGAVGAFQILFNHAPIVSALNPGIIKISDDKGNDILFAAASGFVEVKKNVASIIVEKALMKNEIKSDEATADLIKFKEEYKKARDEKSKLNAKLAADFAEACVKLSTNQN